MVGRDLRTFFSLIYTISSSWLLGGADEVEGVGAQPGGGGEVGGLGTPPVVLGTPPVILFDEEVGEADSLLFDEGRK